MPAMRIRVRTIALSDYCIGQYSALLETNAITDSEADSFAIV